MKILIKQNFIILWTRLGNIIGEVPEESDGCWVFSYVEDLNDKSIDWALKTVQELEGRIQFLLS